MKWFEEFLKDGRSSAIQLLLITGIVIVANIMAEELVIRFDLTENNRYTLSAASEDIAESLEDPVSLTAYFSEDLPPQFSQAKDEFQNFLEEFRAYSEGSLEYEFVNPNESDRSEQKAQQAGIRPVMIDVRERDKVSQKRAYFGAVFHFRDKQEVVPVIQPGSGLEYTIASTIKRLTIENKPAIGLLQGHGEPGQQEIGQLRGELNQQYRLTNVSGLDTTSVPADIEVLMIIAPEQPLSDEQLVAIDQYIMSGGKVVFAVNRIQTQLQQGRATPLNTGIERLLSAYNLPVKQDLIRDANASSIQVQQRQGGFTYVNQVQYPYIPQIVNFGGHPISQGLERTVFQFVSSLDTTQVDSGQTLNILVKSSDRAGIASGRFDLNPMREWNLQNFSEANIPLGAVLEGSFTSAFAGNDSVDISLDRSLENALVVYGDGDFVINGSGQQQQRLPDDNISLMVNTVDWLADDTGLIALRTKGVTNRPLPPLEDGTKTILKYLNVFTPILIVLGYGFYRYRRRRIRRQKWLEEGI